MDVAARTARLPVRAVVLTQSTHVAAELGGDHDVLAVSFEQLTQPRFGIAVGIGRVEQRDSGVESGVHDLSAGVGVQLHAEVVRAESYDGNGQARVAKSAEFHATSLTPR